MARVLLVSEVERTNQRVLIKVLVVLPIEILDLSDRTESNRTNMNMLRRRCSCLCTTKAAHYKVHVDVPGTGVPPLSMSEMTRIIVSDLLDRGRSVLCTTTHPREVSVDQGLDCVDSSTRAWRTESGHHLTGHGCRVW